jgi:hypothetical protein
MDCRRGTFSLPGRRAEEAAVDGERIIAHFRGRALYRRRVRDHGNGIPDRIVLPVIGTGEEQVTGLST